MKKKVAIFGSSDEGINKSEKFCTSRGYFVSKRTVCKDDYVDLSPLTKEGKFNGLVCDSLQVFTCSTDYFTEQLQLIESAGMFAHFLEEDLEFLNDGITPPTLRLLKSLQDIAENTHRKKIMEGLKKSRANGSQSTPGRPPIPKEDVRTAIRMIEDNIGRPPDKQASPKEIQHKANISKTTYYRIVHVTEDLRDKKNSRDFDTIKQENNVSDQLFGIILAAYHEYYGMEIKE